jgi:hypothetical protein
VSGNGILCGWADSVRAGVGWWWWGVEVSILKIMVRTVKGFQISRFWESIASLNKLLNIVTVIEPSLQEEKAH